MPGKLICTFFQRWGQDFTTTFPAITVTCVGLEQVNPEGQKKTYFFKDISSAIEIKSEPDVFAIKMRGSERLVSFLKHFTFTKIY